MLFFKPSNSRKSLLCQWTQYYLQEEYEYFKYFKLNLEEIREELNNADEKRLEKSNNSIQINKIQDNNAENKVEKIDKSNKEEIKEIDNLNEKEDSKTKDQLNKKDVFNEQIPSSMKKKNVNTCCNIF